MHETQLTPDQAWSLMLIFLHMVCHHETPDDPDHSGSGAEYLCDLEEVLCRLNYDNESMTEWKGSFPEAIGRAFSKEDRYAPDEVFATIISLLIYNHTQFGIERDALVSFLQSMKSHPERFEWNLWKKAVQKILDGEIWGSVANSFTFSPTPLPYQPPETATGVLALKQSLRAVHIFLESLCMKCRSRFINNGESFAKYIISIRVDDGYDWMRNYVETFQHPCSITTVIDRKQAYILMVRFLQRVTAKYRLDSEEIFLLLKEMEATPKEYQFEWTCWEQGWQDALEGKYPLNHKKHLYYTQMPTNYHNFIPDIHKYPIKGEK